MVARRHCRLAHGIGRSGDISAEQPKVRYPQRCCQSTVSLFAACGNGVAHEQALRDALSTHCC